MTLTLLKPLFRSRLAEKLLAYLLAVVLTVLAYMLTRMIWGVLDTPPFILFFIPIVISAWVGGLGPGILSTVLAVWLIDTFLIPSSSRGLFPGDELIRFMVFILVAGVISTLEANRRRTKRQLEGAHQQLQVIINAISEGVTAQDAQGQPVFANDAAARILGYENAVEMMTTPVSRFFDRYNIYDETRGPVSTSELTRTRVFETGKTASGTLLVVNKATNEERWLSVTSSPVLGADGKVSLAVNIVRDITERKTREGELLKLATQLSFQKALLDNVIRNVPGIIWEGTGPPGRQRLDFISGYVEKMTGYKPDKWRGREDFLKEIIPPEEYPAVVAEAERIFKTATEGVMEFRVIAADGRSVYIEAHTSIINDPNGQPIGACGVMMDVSDRKRQESVLKDYAEALRNSNNELSQFAYVASHDLQEPLRMVTSYLELLEDRLKGQLTDETREFIDFAVDGAVRMKKLITDLLTYSRVQGGQIEPVNISMDSVVTRVLHNLQVAVEETGTMITHDALPSVPGDEAQLSQLLQNLLANAIKFRRDTPVIHIGVETRWNEWLFSIKDNGIGIEPRFAERIFEIFQRLHGGGTYAGTGIGLAICKKIVQRHGGKIWVESEPGVGSTFYFTIPRKPVNSGIAAY